MLHRKNILRLLALLCSFANNDLVLSYNVDNVTVKRITRPKDTGSNGYIPDGNESFLFGYEFVFHVNELENETRMLISEARVPNTTLRILPQVDTKNNGPYSGKLYSCGPEKSEDFFSSNTTCGPMNIQTHGDSVEEDVGFSTQFNDGENMMTCSLRRNLECSTAVYRPGFCYQTTDGARSWHLIPYSNETTCPISNVDIMFVLDGSGSIGEKNFQKVKDWVLQIVKELDIDGGTVQAGVVQFSHWYKSKPANDQPLMKTEIQIGQHDSFSSFVNAVQNISLQSFTTYTAHALNVTAENFIASERFNDSLTKKVMILLTDGASHDASLLPASADYVRSLGIVTYAIGVGLAVTKELRIIATGDVNSPEFVYEVDNFSGLQRIVDELQEEILKNVLEGTNSKLSSSFKMQMSQVGFSSTTGGLSGDRTRNMTEKRAHAHDGGSNPMTKRREDISFYNIETTTKKYK